MKTRQFLAGCRKEAPTAESRRREAAATKKLLQTNDIQVNCAEKSLHSNSMCNFYLIPTTNKQRTPHLTCLRGLWTHHSYNTAKREAGSRKERKFKPAQPRVKLQRTYFTQYLLNSIILLLIGPQLNELISYIQEKTKVDLSFPLRQSIHRNWQQLSFSKTAIFLVIEETRHKWTLVCHHQSPGPHLPRSPSALPRMPAGKKRARAHSISIWNPPTTTMPKFTYCLPVM